MSSASACRWAGSKRTRALVPYDDHDEALKGEVACMDAERVVHGTWITGAGEVADWSPPTADDEGALRWFLANWHRILNADYEAWLLETQTQATRRRFRRKLTDCTCAA